MKAIIITVLFLFTGNAMAQCDKSIHVTEIPYAKNSSYFPSKYAKQLDKLVKESTEKPGYLLLEFQVLKQQDEDGRKYDMWLANRRIDRIKEYLHNANYSAPIISRILTASSEEVRDVSIHWCDTENNAEKLSENTLEKQIEKADDTQHNQPSDIRLDEINSGSR
ncbi:hypothetical protein [Shewanella sp. UCD-KL12]|uniref:hypothetical protein n=1 Tax=Shewanella sp. UCD-KL12 TaxID=1917163 RepID=UPI0009711FD5|nr:hypothetical protein [Shewanella sp. UCD-KL12]